ncbi:hypothetical protein GCM10027093_61220 [Paraburkholderia jirisanensis]
MTIELALNCLRQRLHEQCDALAALSTTVEEDRPRHSDVAVAAHLADAVLAARGAMEETTAAFATGLADEALDALTRGHAAFLRYHEIFAREVASFERVEHLCTVARERGREWAGWVEVVRVELEQCSECAHRTAEALLDCWQEVAERRGGLSLHNVSIGQQIGCGAKGIRARGQASAVPRKTAPLARGAKQSKPSKGEQDDDHETE